MKQVNVKKLREKLIKDEENKGKNKTDPRFLNYFDLDFNEKMTIRFLPDGGSSGEYWLEYATHGPNLHNPSIEAISCASTSSGERCPACTYSYEFHNDGDRDEAQKWRRKDTSVAQCIVIKSDIEINESEDGNPVKLMYLPYSIKEEIKDSIINGTIDDPINHDFVIKKTKNQGGRASYEKSFFKPNSEDLPDVIVEALEEGVAVLYDLSEELPKAADADEVDAWLEDAIEKMEKTHRRKKKTKVIIDDSDDDDSDDDDNDDDDNDDDDSKDKSSKKTSAKDLLSRIKKRDKD